MTLFCLHLFEMIRRLFGKSKQMKYYVKTEIIASSQDYRLIRAVRACAVTGIIGRPFSSKQNLGMIYDQMGAEGKLDPMTLTECYTRAMDAADNFWKNFPPGQTFSSILVKDFDFKTKEELDEPRLH